MTPALPVGERRFRHVRVSSVALKQAATCPYLRISWCRDQSARGRHEFNSRWRWLRLASVLVGAQKHHEHADNTAKERYRQALDGVLDRWNYQSPHGDRADFILDVRTPARRDGDH